DEREVCQTSGACKGPPVFGQGQLVVGEAGDNKGELVEHLRVAARLEGREHLSGTPVLTRQDKGLHRAKGRFPRAPPVAQGCAAPGFSKRVIRATPGDGRCPPVVADGSRRGDDKSE